MNNLNWPTALVIIAVIFAGAFVYNKPTDAGFDSDGMVATNSHGVWQLKGSKVRFCRIWEAKINCKPWKE